MDHPVAREHCRTRHDGGGRNPIDAHHRTKADGQFPNQVTQRRFARVVSLRTLFRHDRVGGARQHHRRWQLLILKDPLRLAGQQIVSCHIDLKGLRPLLVG